MPIFISCPITEAEQPRECSLESKRPHTERHVVTALEVQPKAQQQGVRRASAGYRIPIERAGE